MTMCLVFTNIFNENVLVVLTSISNDNVFWSFLVSSMTLCFVFTGIFNDSVFGLY